MGVAATARKAGTVVVIVLISLVLGELALRLVDAVRPSYIFQDDSYNRFRVRPGSSFYGFPVNSRGFLDAEFEAKDPRRFRIVALGDSFAFGVVPYDRNYLTLLERRLDRVDREVEVLNMGIPRTAPPDYLNLLVNEGFELEPDLVLVGLYIGNDLTECLELPHPAWERSYVAAMVHAAVRLHRSTDWGAVHVRHHYADDKPRFSESTYFRILAKRASIYVVGWLDLDRSVDIAVAALDTLTELCRRRGIAVAVVLIPEEVQIDPTLQEAVIASSERFRDHAMDFLQPNRALARRLDALRVPFVDLYPAFAEVARSERLYKPRDTHWNIAGNRLAAGEIARFLVEDGLVPPKVAGAPR